MESGTPTSGLSRISASPNNRGVHIKLKIDLLTRWDNPLTRRDIQDFENDYGPTPDTLSELAELIHEIDESHEKDVLPNTCIGLMYKIWFSAKKLRPLLEKAFGKKGAVELFIEITSSINYAPDADNPTLYIWQGGKGKTRAIAEKLEKADRKLHRMRPLGEASTVFPSPPSLQWEDVTITFVSRDSIKIEAKGASEIYMFSDIGFRDGRKRDLPDSHWEKLQAFAEYGGRIAWDTPIPSEVRKGLKKSVSIIRKRLKSLMRIESDPFEAYRKHRAYVVKFKIEDRTFGQTP